MATNVNQMAKRSNGLRIPGDAQEVMFRLRSIEDAVRRFLSGAGLG